MRTRLRTAVVALSSAALVPLGTGVVSAGSAQAVNTCWGTGGTVATAAADGIFRAISCGGVRNGQLVLRTDRPTRVRTDTGSEVCYRAYQDVALDPWGNVTTTRIWEVPAC